MAPRGPPHNIWKEAGRNSRVGICQLEISRMRTVKCWCWRTGWRETLEAKLSISPSGALSNFKSTLLSVNGKTLSLSSTEVQLIFLKAPKSPAYSIPWYIRARSYTPILGRSNRSCAYNASSAVLVLDKKAPGRGNLVFRWKAKETSSRVTRVIWG